MLSQPKPAMEKHGTWDLLGYRQSFQLHVRSCLPMVKPNSSLVDHSWLFPYLEILCAGRPNSRETRLRPPRNAHVPVPQVGV